MSLYGTFSVFIVMAAIFAYVNYRFVRLPSTIGLMIIAIITSLLMIAAGKFFPVLMKDSVSLLHNFNFSELLLGSMLSFILFAGAIHVNAKELRQERFSILTYSSLGILLSTFIIGTILYYLLPVFQLHVPWLQCLLFGILISPTDPIAVLAILRKAGIKKSTEIKITGESLFNDGVAVVIFMTILSLAKHTGEIHWTNVGWLFIREAGGGLLLGILIGYGSYLLMRSIDNYKVEVLLSVAVVMGGYTIADRLEVSGPLAMVAAGILVGNKGRRQAMSDTTWNYINSFWELIDEIMNAILFVLIGLELLIIPFDINYLVIGSVTILIALSSRYISVWLPGQFIRLHEKFSHKTMVLLTWGGLRGGISIALALSLPENLHQNLWVSVTYVVVAFSIIVQGLTISNVAEKQKVSSQSASEQS